VDTDVSTLAGQIATRLGSGWQAAPGEWVTTLHGPHGERLSIHRARYQGSRISIHGRYPDVETGQGLPSHQITAAISRGPTAIAADITRRLLPGYRTDLAKAAERIARLAREDAQRERLAAELVATIPGATLGPDAQHATVISWYSQAAGSGSIRLCGAGTSAQIELSSVPAAVAATIAATIAHAESAPAPQAGEWA